MAGNCASFITPQNPETRADSNASVKNYSKQTPYGLCKTNARYRQNWSSNVLLHVNLELRNIAEVHNLTLRNGTEYRSFTLMAWNCNVKTQTGRLCWYTRDTVKTTVSIEHHELTQSNLNVRTYTSVKFQTKTALKVPSEMNIRVKPKYSEWSTRMFLISASQFRTTYWHWPLRNADTNMLDLRFSQWCY